MQSQTQPHNLVPASLLPNTELPTLLRWAHDKLDVSVRAKPLQNDADNPLRAYLLDLSRFRLRLSENTPCLIVTRELCESHLPVQLKRLLMETIVREGWQRRNTLVLVKGTADELKTLMRSELLPPLILDGQAQARITQGAANSNILIEEISKQAPISALSVYETNAPVQGEQFFGRESELRELQQKAMTSFLIVGNRRMGKTSLVREIKRRLSKQSRGEFQSHVYLDCSVFKNKQDFFAEIIRELDGVREIERLYKDKTFSMQSFLLRMHRSHQEKIVLYLDEVDKLLKWDAQTGWEVMHTLRGIAASDQHTQQSHNEVREDNQPLRVIMAGFRDAQVYVERNDTPLFNFAQLMKVTNFDARATEQLVTEPMLNLGLSFVDKSGTVNRIYRETGGQPNLIQHYCHFMVKRLEESGEREISPKLLDDVLGDDALRRRTTDELMSNASNLEQFIVFNFITHTQDKVQKGAGDAFTMEQVDGWMKEHGLQLLRSDMEKALYALETSGILVRDGQKYKFAFAVLPRMLAENWNVHYQLEKILEEGVM